MNAKTKLRNTVFKKLQERASFDHAPRTDAVTAVIREFEAEGLVSITEAGMFTGALWQVERIGRW